MSTYLSLDINWLFETQSIAEIEEINKKIQNEVEEKKKELKILVGERYRDLIQAADSIAEMKVTSEKIENVIKSKEFNNYTASQASENEQKHRFNNSSVVQLKVLTNLIELISSAIDENDFLIATQLFLLSRHITTGLKLNTNNDLLKKFPVVMKQWSLLTTFRGIIKQRCLSFLENECILVDTTAKCLASLLLLENDGNLEKLLQKFIHIRTKTFLNVVESQQYEVIKEKLLASITELTTTVQIVYECFVKRDESEGLIVDELKKLPPTFDFLLSNQKSAIFQTVPDIVLKYRPNVQISPLSEEVVFNCMSAWMESIDRISNNQLKELVKFIVSINTIRDIKEKVNSTLKPSNWSNICHALFKENDLEFYNRFYQPLMFERIHSIIKISWKNVQDEFAVELEKLISMNERVHRDMKYYVWTNDDSDNPLSLKDATSINKRSHHLLMKVNGYNKYIVDICNKIDANLEQLLSDLKQYLYGMPSKKELKRIEKINSADHDKIVSFLRECSKENISDLITYTRSSNALKTSENSHLIARLLQSFTEICPNLKQCLSTSLITDSFILYNANELNTDEEWDRMVNLLLEESIRFWKLWLDEFVNQWPPLESEIDLNSIIRNSSTWQSITIEEKDENDQMIQSQIHVPQQISLSIQIWIFNISSILNRIIPHTLPKSIHLKIIDEMTSKLLQHYELLSKHNQVTSNQKLAWQFFFDLKVLGFLFVRRDNKTITETMQQLVNTYRAIIDPFDFDVFHPHVAINIKRNAARLQYDMGCLIPNMEILSSILSNVAVPTTQDEPNIMMMSDISMEKSWFPLLPIVKSKEILAIQEEPKEKTVKQPQKSASKKSSMHASASASALSSFQDWFK